MTRIDKPALLRQLFHLGSAYSGQILSYQKILGQLQDAGNTTTLAHYLELLGGAGMIAGLQKYAGQQVRQRASSPKLQALNTALISALSPLSFKEAKRERDFWGRLVESAVGAHLVNYGAPAGIQTYFWREGGMEVDFILRKGKATIALEVKSGRRRESLAGMDAFSEQFHPQRKLLVGEGGIPIERLLATAPAELFD
jgi:predicted AAA+ superfamily ATPase